MTLIKDLIEIPDRVQKGDFVLQTVRGHRVPGAGAGQLRRHAGTGQGLRRGPDVHPQRHPGPHQQGDLPARQLRQRQEPLHGRAAPDPPRQHGGPGDPGTGVGHPEAQRLAGRQAVPAGALPHARTPTTWSRASSAATWTSSAASTPARRRHRSTCRRRLSPRPMPSGPTTATRRSSSGSTPDPQAGARRRERLGRTGCGVGCSVVRCRRRGAARLGIPSPPGEHAVTDGGHLACRGHRHRGGRFVRFDKGLSIISQHAKRAWATMP